VSGTERPVAIVTGATRPRRVGLAIACELARAGCDVVVTHRGKETEAEAALGAIRAASGGRGAVRAERLELDDAGMVEEMGRRWAERLGRVDVLVHNASMYEPTPLETVEAEQVLRFFRVNALAPLLLSRALAGVLARSPLAGGGAIVSMCDIHVMGEIGQPRKGFYGYGMSKAGLLELTMMLARELAPRVRVNAVAPGVVAFPEAGHESDRPMQEAYLKRVPLGRSGTPEDAARAVRWLALEATYTTGQVVRVDGGRFIT
jgi:pteridine reductase